jgi:DNA-directed RNA polymerase specialized sigma24 family protein
MNAVRDHFRSRRWVVLQPLDEENPEHQVAQVPTDELSERSRLMRRLATHFAGLRPALRLPLVLALLHGYTVPEIAVILDIGFEAAKKRLLRGRRELLDSLEQDPYCRAILAEMGR